MWTALNRQQKQKALGLALLAMALVTVLLNLPLCNRLSLTSVTGDIEYISPASDFFEVEYIHSVNKSPVIERYQLEQGMILLHESRYQQFGTGMQFEEDENSKFTLTEEWIIVSHSGKTFEEIQYRVGTEAMHSFRAGKVEFYLRDYFPEQSVVRFRVKRYSILFLLLKGGF